MNRILAFPLILAAGLLCTGCQSHRETWVGSWSGERKGITRPEMEDEVARQVRRVTLEIRPDLTFTLVELSQTKTGEVKLSEKEARLTITKELGKIVDPTEVTLLLTGPNQAELWTKTNLTPASVTLTRSNPPSSP